MMALSRLSSPNTTTRFAARTGTTLVAAAPTTLRGRLTSSRRSSTVVCMAEKLDKSTPDSTWKKVLSAQQYHILREKGTEPPGSGQYNKFYEDGVYKCAGCGTPLYKSDTKFDSGCGWPAFYAELPGAVSRHEDRTGGMVRVEITCSNCDAHLGHVFEGEGFRTPTNQRHCVNSVSLKFQSGSN